MFTGIVTALGRVARVAPVAATKRADGNGDLGGLELRITAPLKGLRRGESIAVNGACLTVERVLRGGFTAHVVGTTLGRTLFGEYAVGRRVNLERAVRAGDRMGGHWVQGHVDGIATVAGGGPRGDGWVYGLRVPRPVRDVSVLLGSITVDGVSLTVNTLGEGDVVEVSLVPFTREHTTLGGLAAGDRVHVEGDILGKYVKALCRSAP